MAFFGEFKSGQRGLEGPTSAESRHLYLARCDRPEFRIRFAVLLLDEVGCYLDLYKDAVVQGGD